MQRTGKWGRDETTKPKILDTVWVECGRKQMAHSTEETLIKGVFTKMWAGLREAGEMVLCPGARDSGEPFPPLVWRDKEANTNTQRSKSLLDRS